LSGALYAHFTGFISPQDFLPILTFQIYAMVIIGGVGRHAGAVLGAFVVWEIWSVSGILIGSALPSGWQDRVGALRVVLIALCLLLVLLMRPSGLMGAKRVQLSLRARRQAR
jgi:branched-chain amino acid transport system permease protein